MEALTERLRIEALSPAHAAFLFEPLAAPALYDYVDDAPCTTVDALAARFAHLASGGRGDEAWHNWVAFARDSGAPVATLQATRFADGRALVAYAVMPDHWRRGIATEAVTWLLGWLRAAGATRAEALIDTRNHASIALVAKLGFTQVATIRDAAVVRGATSDEHRYQLELAVDRSA